MTRAIIGIAALLFGCTVISSKPTPVDWPKLKIITILASHAEMREVCGKVTGPFMSPQGCAVIQFSRGECIIIESADFPLSPSNREHEYEHCAGKDHVGESTLADGWLKYKATHHARVKK